MRLLHLDAVFVQQLPARDLPRRTTADDFAVTEADGMMTSPNDGAEATVHAPSAANERKKSPSQDKVSRERKKEKKEKKINKSVYKPGPKRVRTRRAHGQGATDARHMSTVE